MFKGIKQGVGIALGVLLTCGVFAFTVSGSIKTWTAGETLTHTDLNQNVQTLKTAIEGATQLGWSSFSANSNTTYASFMTYTSAPSEAIAQFPMPRAATVKTVRITPYSNTCTSATTVTLRVNGADTGTTVSIPAGSTTPVTTATTTDLIAGNLVDWKAVCATGNVSGLINFEF